MGSLHLALVALSATLTLPRAAVADLLFCGNKFCGIEAVCNQDSNKCECPLSRPLGDPAFRCHSDDTVSCVLIGDPSLQGFTSDLTFMDFPCKYTFTKFDTPLLSRRDNYDPVSSWDSPDPGRDRCRLIVNGINQLTPKGAYNLKEVHVDIAIKIGDSKHLEMLKVKLTGGSATYTYGSNPEVTVTQSDGYGCVPRVMDYTAGIGLNLCYLQETRIWSFGVPMCGGTSVNFRAWEGESDNQPLRPGVAITTTGDVALFSKENGYPTTMCDSPFNDAEDVYHDTCKKLGIVGKRNCAFNAFLSNNPTEQPHYCVPSIQLFNLCSVEKRVHAINACGDIVTKLAKCVLKNNKDVMNVFEGCIYAACFNPDTCSAVAGDIHHGDDDDCNSFQAPC